MPSSPASILQDIFGYDDFRPFQHEIITNVLARKDTLAIMPTGGGKSLCYQIPALIFPGLTVVVSPLIALMKDQVEQLNELGVPAIFLNSSLTFDTYQKKMQQVRSGQIKLLYVAPETLLTPRLFNLLSDVSLDCLTIDEAHCISEWGHDFRPEYRQLVGVRERFPKAVCLALTATATPRVRQDIKTSLGFENSNEFIASFDRANLLIEVNPKTDPTAQTLEFIRRFPDQSGIIYCFSRKQVDELTTTLVKQGFSVRPYHAGLPDAERKENQELFIRDDIQIIVATIAFGMGINKPNVRFILHYSLPKSIESYYQEIGRAGRDGLPAHCLLLYSYTDVQKLKYFIEQKEDLERQVAYEHLKALTRYAESDVCRRVPLLAYFSEKYTTENCGMCDVCRKGEQNLVDLTIPAQKFLSCVKRTGEIFGATHIVDVLLGLENQKVLKFDHQKLSTYGIGKDLSKKQWLHISRQLIQRGLLAQDDPYRGLQLTLKAVPVLQGSGKFLGILEPERAAQSIAGKAGKVKYDPGLFEILRKKRKELADAAHVPPYVIFPDKTLMEMAVFFPASVNSLKKIFGVGSRKLVKYGQVFIDVITAYSKEHRLVEKRKPGTRRTEVKSGAERQSKHIQVGEVYNAGASIQELMEQFGVQQGTILNHLSKYILEGYSLRSSDFLALPDLPEDLLQNVMEAFKSLGTEYLKPVYEELDGAVNYDDLRLLRLYYLTTLPEKHISSDPSENG
ncbi:MAG: DNA helicase RecQ [Chloroflexota bacterium]